MFWYVEIGSIYFLDIEDFVLAFAYISVHFLLIFNITSFSQLLTKFSYLLSELLKVFSHILVYFHFHFQYFGPLGEH